MNFYQSLKEKLRPVLYTTLISSLALSISCGLKKDKKYNIDDAQSDSLVSKDLSFNSLGHYLYNYPISAGLDYVVAGDFDNDGDLDLAIIGSELGESYSHLLHITFLENKLGEKPPRFLKDDALESGR